MEDAIKSFIQAIKPLVKKIDVNRKDDLNLFAEVIESHLDEKGSCAINFICTHNSRRSQLGEFILRILTNYKGLNGITTFSGGTEATAFNHRMVSALNKHGFHFESTVGDQNPIYTYASEDHILQQKMFSKKYSHDFNPQDDFIAVMVCDHADENCPIILGASHRISLPYIDPKVADDTPEESEAYYEKVEEVGSEMWYLCEILEELMANG